MFAKGFVITSLLLLTSVASAAYASEGVTSRQYDLRDVVRDEATGTIVRSSSGACVRTKWVAGTDACASDALGKPLSREERTVYFGFNQASLTPEMKQRLDTLSDTLRSQKQVKGVRIVGYADRMGNPGYNEKLSKKRAQNVRQYLIAKGLVNARVADTRWFGASTPATNCPADLKREELIECLQKDRRVEVEIDYTPDLHAAN